MITLAPVAGDVASLIAAWEAPPEVTPDLPAALAEVAPDLAEVERAELDGHRLLRHAVGQMHLVAAQLRIA